MQPHNAPPYLQIILIELPYLLLQTFYILNYFYKSNLQLIIT